jgi:uncharacterized protein YegL
MEVLGESVVDGVNQFIDSQKKNSCKNTYITITTFDDVSETIVDDCKLENIDKINYDNIKPRGFTVLIDTAMNQLRLQQKRVKKKSIDNYKCVFAILTDGHDNMSKEWKSNDLKTYIRCLEKKCNFVSFFLASNQDAISSGSFFGFKPDRCITYSNNSQQVTSTFKSLSTQIINSSNGNKNIAFTSIQRASSIAVNNTPVLKTPTNTPLLMRANTVYN